MVITVRLATPCWCLRFWNSDLPSQRIYFSKGEKAHREESWILGMWFPYWGVTTVKKKGGGRRGIAENAGMIEINVNPKSNLCTRLCAVYNWNAECYPGPCTSRETEKNCRERHTRDQKGFRMYETTLCLKSWVFARLASSCNSSGASLGSQSEILQGPRQGWQPLIHQIPETQTGSPNGTSIGPF